MPSSARDKCFQDAIKKYNENVPADKKIDVLMDHPWVLKGGTWEPLPGGPFRSIYEIFYKARGYQLRFPDISVKVGEKYLNLDNKFTQADGKPEQWQNRKGAVSGRTQRQDNNQMNGQQGFKKVGNDPSLNKDKCKCKERSGKSGEPQAVRITHSVEVKQFDPMMYQGRIFILPPHGIVGILGRLLGAATGGAAAEGAAAGGTAAGEAAWWGQAAAYAH
jgi:hypothetical protein